MSIVGSWLPYALGIATIAAGAIDLYQKREELKQKPLRGLIIALFVLTGALSLLAFSTTMRTKRLMIRRLNKTPKS